MERSHTMKLLMKMQLQLLNEVAPRRVSGRPDLPC